MPSISVLMPVYNAERFLAVAIESILNQTFTDFEFLIIDDCSTDSSVSIVESYSDPRIRFYRNAQNLGISPTLNKGIELARAPLIARMDSDDISYPERLQKQYDFIQAKPDGALYSCWVKVINQDGAFIRQDNFNSNFYFYNLVFICWIYHPTIIFRKQEITSVGMYTVPYAEDFELFWQVSRKFKIYNVPAVLLDYRVTDQSLHQVTKKKEYDAAQYEQLLRNFRYYAGDGYTLAQDCVDCLQHNFTPLLQQGNIKKIQACIQELEMLNKLIIKKENVNRDEGSMIMAAYHKRRFIIEYFAENLHPLKAIVLLLRLKEYSMLKNKLKKRLKKII